LNESHLYVLVVGVKELSFLNVLFFGLWSSVLLWFCFSSCFASFASCN